MRLKMKPISSRKNISEDREVFFPAQGSPQCCPNNGETSAFHPIKKRQRHPQSVVHSFCTKRAIFHAYNEVFFDVFCRGINATAGCPSGSFSSSLCLNIISIVFASIVRRVDEACSVLGPKVAHLGRFLVSPRRIKYLFCHQHTFPQTCKAYINSFV